VARKDGAKACIYFRINPSTLHYGLAFDHFHELLSHDHGELGYSAASRSYSSYVTPSTPALAFFRNPRNAAYNVPNVIMCPIEKNCRLASSLASSANLSEFCGHSSESSVSRLCFPQQIRQVVPPFPPSSVTYGLPWRPSTTLARGDRELFWVYWKSSWKHALS
jgi:hypothetical protein